MDSLSLFQSMQGNVNPMGAYAAGSKLANDMLAIQSQQAQQVFQNLYNSAQQAENRRQFEQTMAFREQQAADESARGWFNAQTQRMAYDPSRQKPTIDPSAFAGSPPQVVDIGGGRQAAFTKNRFGGDWDILPQAKTTGSLPPAGIITANQAQQQPMPAGVIIPGGQPEPMPTASGSGMNLPNPPMDSSLFQDTGTVQAIPDNPLLPALPGMAVAPQERPVSMPSALPQPIPTADVITATPNATMFGDATQVGTIGSNTPNQLTVPPAASTINPQRPVVTAAELQPSTARKSQDIWPSVGQQPEVVHDGFGGLTKKGRGPQGEKTIQYGTINEKGQMRWLGEPESMQSEIVPKVVTVKGITFAQTGKNSWSIYKPDGEKQGLSDAGQMMALEKIYEEKKEIAKNESNLAEEDAAIKATLATNDDATVKAKSAAFKAEIGHLPKSPADWDYASKAYERSLKSQRYEEYNRLLEVSREKVDRLEGLLLPGATELQSPQSGPATTTGNTTSVGRDYLNRVRK
jgi:hypothetical protein